MKDKPSVERSSTKSGLHSNRKLAMLQTLFVLSLAAVELPKYQISVQGAAAEDSDLTIIEHTTAMESTLAETKARRRFHHDGTTAAPTAASENHDILVVVTVDGTMAGISQTTGDILWKQQQQQKPHHQTNQRKSPDGWMQPPLTTTDENKDASALLLRPLLSTTTTTHSAATSDYAAVPSIDGNVYLTGSKGETTVSTSVKELVQRAPFLDPQGRFYVGSRQTTVAALDSQTGELLQVVSSQDKEDYSDFSKEWKDRSVLWMGRVDYSVTVQDARTGMKSVQFSVSEIQNVQDWNKDARLWDSEGVDDEDHHHYQHGKQEQQQTNNGRLDPWTQQWKTLPNGVESDQNDGSLLPLDEEGAVARTKRLVSTPSGNLALLHPHTGQVQWVASEQFSTPIAFGLLQSGWTVPVDIIPDVTVPSSNDMEYLSKELERQIQLLDCFSMYPENGSLEDADQTIVGKLEGSGQLYALPLGQHQRLQRAIADSAANSLPHATNHHAATIASTAKAKHKTTLPQWNGHRTSSRLSSSHHQDSSHPTSGPRKPCHPTSPHFPSCLVDHHKHQPARLEYFAKGTDNRFVSEGLPPHAEGKHELILFQKDQHHRSYPQHPETVIYHPEYGYVDPHHFAARPKAGYSRILKILGSWLPPTIALIFVLSFELGRRKRLKDEQQEQQQTAKNPTTVISTMTQEQTLTNGMTEPSSTTEPKSSINGEPSSVQATSKASIEMTIPVSSEQAITAPSQQAQHVIQVSDQVLGYGGQGTVVYKGVLDGRDVAVKRMLKAYHASADREIRLLIESDGHPHVVRYFLKEVRGDFVYLALELCDMSLHDLIGILRTAMPAAGITENKMSVPTIPLEAAKVVLQQIASGVRHLHSLRIVHRDLKPANILLAITKSGKKKNAKKEESTTYETFLDGSYIAKISDMGLGKQIVGQSSLGASLMATSSFQGTKGGASSVGVGPGSVGWQAPEVMALRWVSSDASARSGESNTANPESSPIDVPSPTPRTSRSVDIFSLGCIFYSTLVPGHHPFGEWYEREANIVHNRPNIDALERISSDAFHLVRSMLSRDARLRPTAKQICEHPFFWTSQRKLSFLCEFSDRLETDTTTPTSIQLISSLVIERGAVDVVGTSWDGKLDEPLINNMQRFRSYDPSSVRDLLRLIRNKHHHFDELPEDFRSNRVVNQDALLEYFERKFPRLLMHCWDSCRSVLSGGDPLMVKYDVPPLQAIKPETCKLLSTRAIAPESVVVNAPCKELQESTVQEAESGDGCVLNFGEQLDERSATRGGGDEEWIFDVTADAVSKGNTEFHVSPLDTENEAARNIVVPEAADDVIAWEGSTSAKELNCRGWSRSESEWARRIDPVYRKKDPNLKRAMEDPKFRTRLCNHWDQSMGTFCPMRKRNKCVFAHGPVELRVKEGKKNRWGKLVDKNGDNKNPRHSGGEDTYGAARSIEVTRKEEGKWNTGKGTGKKPAGNKKKKSQSASGDGE